MKAVMSRRAFLRGAGGAMLALPFLESRLARAAEPSVPLRLVVYQSGEGNLMERFVPPVLSNDALELSEMLAPLTAHQEKMVVISGISNKVGPLHSSNGHNAKGHTLMSAQVVDTTGTGSFSAGIDVLQGMHCLGPSIDHFIANELQAPLPINLAIGDANPGENRMWYKVKPTGSSGANPEATLNNNPTNVFNTYLAGGEPAPTSRAERFRSQRTTVLDGVFSALKDLRVQLGAADRLRLEAHADAVRAIESGLHYVPPVQCGGLTQTLPPGYTASRLDLQADAMIDVMVSALACGASRFITLQDTQYDSPNFNFLPVGPVSGWHAQVHNDPALGLGYGSSNDNPTLKAGFLYYASVFNQLLDKMDTVIEPNGMTLLDNSLVLWISEFGAGQSHSSDNLPVVIAGGAQGQIVTNRHLPRTGATTGDLFTSIANAFGIPVSSFGYNDGAGFNHGGVAGLLG